MSALALDRIRSNLSRLKLSRIDEILEQAIKTSEKEGKSYLSFFDELLEEEVICKEQRRVMALFDLTFIREKSNLVLLGPPGVGKSHLAVSLALKACQAGMSIYFTNMEDLIRKLKKDRDAGRPGRGRSYHKSALVIVDGVGYTPIDRDEGNLFFRFIANRYEKASTIITSNKAFSDWTELFHDPVIVTAFLDRLLHHSVVINIQGPSYRLRGKAGVEETQQ